ncbi:DUF1569 domain-containing protein [Psychroflexus aestuariivivens]|uniref:DUF1569 domain-containing protein n=1 Tax=Psychroflexus aestuariivivens TaxID=1795040 RepID=UPI000FDA9844|nr:DUF1569 domain-containing protein [Psychroflexus aestuariivivens]
MKSLYNQKDFEGILNRLNDLKPDADRKWGKMNIAQMLAHLNTALETALGLNFPKRIFIGRIIGKYMKKKFFDEKPMAKNLPTVKEYTFTDFKDFEKEKLKTIELVKQFYKKGPKECTTHPHSFFGNLTPEEWAILQWKHFDHHLRQFSS